MVILIVALGYSLWSTISQQRAMSGSAGLSLRPVNPNGLYSSWLYYELRPGDRVQDSLMIRNGFAQSLPLVLGVADAEGDFDKGTYALKDGLNTSGIGVARWIDLKVDSLDLSLSASTEQPIAFDLTVTNDADLGVYMGGIYARYMPEQSDEGIKTQLRIALRTIVRVTDDPKPIPPFEPISPGFPRVYLLLSAMLTSFALFLIFSLYGYFPS